MTTSVDTVKANLESFLYNPAGIQSVQVSMVREVHDGTIDFVDAGNPLLMLMEASAINTAAFIARDQRSVRQMYPYLAQTEEDLYLHMSDKDYVDRFAVPSTARFTFFLNKAELLSKMVLEESTGIRKVVIPRSSYITVAETIFSLQYPVEIRVLNHGGLQVIYNVEEVSPIKTLSSNLIDWLEIRADDGTEMLAFELEFSQFNITERSVAINASQAIQEKIALTDSYYFCRVFRDDGTDNYVEIRTTHSDTVYDPEVPTAVLKVVDGQLTVKIPQIYVDNGLISQTLRIFVYTTKGSINIPLQSYTSDTIEKTFFSIYPYEIDDFVAPLSTFNQFIIQASTSTIGGARAMTFDELAARVKNNAMGDSQLPITPAQITSALNRSGYSVVKNIDNIANRTYLAVRSMPEPEDSDLITAAAAGIGTLPSKITDIIGRDTVIDNGTLVTILPDTLYKIESGILKIVSKAEQDALDAMPTDQRALLISRRSYFYTPFYYVLDTSNSEFDVRAYHLDSPTIKDRSFIAENDSSGFQVSISTIGVNRTSYGYQILIKTKSSDNWKAIDDADAVIQLAISPEGGSDLAYVNGTLLSKTSDNERIYEIQLQTNTAINSDNKLIMTNLTMFSDDPTQIGIDLSTKVHIFFVTTAAPQANWTISETDSLLGYYLLGEGAYALTHETFTLVSGQHLKYLWTRARSTVSEADYVRYSDNVPATYEEDVYAIDPETGARFQIDGDGNVQYLITHYKGDPILNGDGGPVYKYYKDEVKKDEYGEPIIANQRGLLRQIDIVLIEGVYKFATDPTAQTYKTQLTADLVEWLTEELPSMGTNLLENTELFLYPTSSIGNVDILYGSSLQTTIDAAQTFSVTYFVRADVYANPSLRQAIETKTIKIIGDYLKNVKVAVSDMVEALKDACGADVLSVSLKGLAGDRNLDMLTILTAGKRLSLKKRLINRSDEVLYLQEAVDIEFIRHTTQ